MPMMEGVMHQPGRSPSSDCDSSSDDDDSNSVLPHARRRRPIFPIPHSHWFPRPISFRAYAPRVARQQIGANAPRLHIQVARPLAYKLTKDIVGTYQNCNIEFTFSPDLNPKRFLTVPSTIVSENGLDNEKHDLVMYFNQVLANDDGTRRYIVKDLVGSGTFGQVAKCYTEETNEYVAVKVIKNLPAYYNQAKFEIGILHMLNKTYDPDDRYHIIRSLDHFQHHGHLCIVFELLTENLYELLKKTDLKGMPLVLVRMFTKQLLESLSLLREARVIHCDLKPENILLIESFRSADLKLIDFGSACKEDQTVYTYIQSRFYRSPEVLLGHPYTTAIDMWSLGCVAAELFLGLPLFPGACDVDMLLFIKEKLGSQPPDHILRNAKYTNKFFKLLTAAPHSDQSHTSYQLLTAEEYETRHKKKPDIGRRYFHGTLSEAIMGYHMRPMSPTEQVGELRARESFVDFLRGLIECDPRKRWTPQQAALHPFVTEEPYTGPYLPVPETPRTPVHQGHLMEHRGPTGHWFCAGLSPQVGGLSLGPRTDGSPQQHLSHYSQASSYGSMGSFGSVGEGLPVDSNFEGYMDDLGANPMGMNGQRSTLGSSPESSWQGRPLVPSFQGVVQLGVNSSSGGGYRYLNLGASPSQFTSQGPMFQQSPGPFAASPGSFPSSPASSFFPSTGSPSQQGSPNRYGPASPARGGLWETAIGNATAANGHYHRRRHWQAQVPAPSTGHGSPQQEYAQWSRLQQSNANGNMDASSAGNYDVQGGLRRGAPPVPPSRSVRNGSSTGTSHLPRSSSSYAPGTLGACLSPGSSMDGADEDSVIGPHWDPNFSDEFLQEDAQDTGAGTKFAGSGQDIGIGLEGGCHVSQGGTSEAATSRRTSQGHVSTSSSMAGSPSSSHSSQSGYYRQKHGYYSPNQTSPSRLGPQLSQSLQQQRHQQGHHHHPQSPHMRPQLSPDQTPLHSHHGGRRHISGEVNSAVPPGTASFQQRQAHQFQQHQLPQQYQQQPHGLLQLHADPPFSGLVKGNPNDSRIGAQGGFLPSPQRDNRIAYIGVAHNTLSSNPVVSRMYSGQIQPNGNSLSATGFPMASGIGQPMHVVQQQLYYEELHHQLLSPGAFLHQGPYFANELFSLGPKSGSQLVGGVRPPTAPARR